MRHLKYQAAVKILITVALFAAWGQAHTFDGSSEPVARADSPTERIPAIPLRSGSSAAIPRGQAQRSERQSVGSLILTIEDAPFTDRAAIGSGTRTHMDWLGKQDKHTGLQKIPASHGLLPDLFGKPSRQKDMSIKGKLLFDEDAEEITEKIDGAGVSIKYQTD